MQNEKKINEENEEKINKGEKKMENTKISFKASKDLTEEEIVKLPKVMVKLEKKISSNKKNVNYLCKMKFVSKENKSIVITKYLQEVVYKLVLHSWGKDDESNKDYAYENCSIRFSKGMKDGKEYFAFDLFLTNKRRLFDFLTEDEYEYLTTFKFGIDFEDRVYFDESGYEFKPENF